MQKFKKLSIVVLLMISTGLFFYANGQSVSVKTNLPYLATTTPNLGFEFALGQKVSLELTGGYNPFEFSGNKQLKHWVVWPELRYWTCGTFNGHFFGLHGVGGEYNLGGWDVPIWKLSGLKDNRYEGYAIGVGLSYGYQWILSDRWGLEFTIGGGYVHFDYDVYSLGENGAKKYENKRDYFGPTKGALSLVYIIN